MCRHATTTLPAEPQSAPAARDFVRSCFTRWDLLPMVDDAQLALTELVTNGVLHARTPLRVSASCENGVVELAVFDGSPVLPQLRPERTDLAADLDVLTAAEIELGGGVHERDPRLDVGRAGSVAGGRGLLLVDALVAEWGVSPLSDGKAVWIRSPTPPGWPHAVGCPCSTAPAAAPLASGKRAVDRS